MTLCPPSPLLFHLLFSPASGKLADMHYRLRTLLIVLAIGPMVLALAWFTTRRILESRQPEIIHFDVGFTPAAPVECEFPRQQAD
jgi:hypothetical protein